MDTPAGQTNITRALEALSPYINSPRRTVIRIEAFVGLAAALLFLQLILGANRRRSGHWFVQGGLWLCYTFSFPLIAYTIGQMVSSPIKNGLYPLWAVLLFWAAGCTDSVTVYALEESKLWKRHLFEVFQHIAYLVVIIQLINPTPDTSSLYFNISRTSGPPVTFTFLLLSTVLMYVSSIARVLAGMIVTNPSPSKVVADYMRDLVDSKETFDPITLKGCRYIVAIRMAAIGKGSTYRYKLCIDDIVTINTIWESEEFDDRLKDVCLSFALSRLLKRRFYGLECAEAHLPEMRNFVLRGFLKQEDKENNYARAFQIIEVELGFLYDFFFTKYAAFAQHKLVFLLCALFRLITISVCGEYVLRGSFIIKTSKPVIEVGTTKADVTITLVIIATLMLVEALQVILHVASDWVTVELACRYTGTRSRRAICRKFIGSIILCLGRFSLSRTTKSGRFLQSLNLFGYWQNKMGQSSLIQDCLHVNPISGPFKELTDVCFAMIHPRKTFVPVLDLVKSEIVSCLRERSKKGGALTNGKEALRNGKFDDDFVAVLDSGSQAMIMLIWHIATEYCDIASPYEADERDPHRRVATTLSRYCAYLMSFIPDLLPGNSTDTTFVNRVVLMEANELLHGREPITKDILVAAIPTDSISNNNEDTLEQGSTRNNNEDIIFIKGLKMGRVLEDRGVGHWKILAEFWAETIIFIAPSDNVNAHMERLAQGGEFLTHIWALLNHAGILKRDQDDLAPEVEDMVQP